MTTPHDFDAPVERRGTDCLKWDAKERLQGLEGDDVISMWIADSDFRTPDVVRDALHRIADFGVPAYFGGLDRLQNAVAWWMETRHGWSPDPSHILLTGGLGNAIAMLIDALTEPGQPVLTFTPVYHEFGGKIARSGRRALEAPLQVVDGRQTLDLDAAEVLVTPDTRLMLFCSPNNPGGRVWTKEELQSVADFAIKHDLILVSDEIHHDLVYPGHHFAPMAHCKGIEDRLVTLTAPSKTFNTAGLRCGQMTIANDALRRKMTQVLTIWQIQPNMAGVEATIAAYSPEGADYVDQQVAYLDGNRRAFDTAVNAIPGARSMELEGTFLSWVDFSGTGMDDAEIQERVIKRARIVPSLGPTFGKGGEKHLRFNIATQRVHVEDAAARLQAAFSDLQ